MSERENSFQFGFDQGAPLSGQLIDDPDGLPAGAIAFADFKNGTYHYGGNTIDDFLTENLDYGTSDAVLTPGIGLVGGVAQSYITIASGLTADLISSGASVVVNLVLADVAPDVSAFNIEMLDLPDWNQEVIAQIYLSQISAWGDAQVYQMIDESTAYEPGPGHHRLAVSLSEDGASLSLNGMTHVDSPLTAPFIATNMGFYVQNATLESIAFYASSKTGIELEALSAA